MLKIQSKILVVDDDKDNRDLLRKILEPLGYAVSEAADGNEALAALEKELPDAVLLDVNMPERDGFSVCEAIKSDPRSRLIPVIMLTALDGREERLKALSLGVDEFLGKPFDVSELTVRVRALVSLKHYTDELEHATNVFKSLAHVIEKRDGHTSHHCERVAEMAVKIARAMGVEKEDLKHLHLGSLLHDLGKVAIPDTILLKPGRLTSEEFAVIKTHPALGAELVEPMGIMKYAIPLIRHHHEKLDGSGYPDGLKAEQIPLPVRILSVADIYDALASRRSYKEALPKEKCLEILREEAAKGWWDKDVIEALAEIVA